MFPPDREAEGRGDRTKGCREKGRTEGVGSGCSCDGGGAGAQAQENALGPLGLCLPGHLAGAGAAGMDASPASLAPYPQGGCPVQSHSPEPALAAVPEKSQGQFKLTCALLTLHRSETTRVVLCKEWKAGFPEAVTAHGGSPGAQAPPTVWPPPCGCATVRLQLRAPLVLSSQAASVVLQAIRLCLEPLGLGAASWWTRLRACGEGLPAAGQREAAITRAWAQGASTRRPHTQPAGQAAIAGDVAGLVRKAASAAKAGAGECGRRATPAQQEVSVQGAIGEGAQWVATVQQGEAIGAHGHLAHCSSGHRLDCLGDLVGEGQPVGWQPERPGWPQPST